MASLHPSHGARVVLERESTAPESTAPEVRYRARIYLPDTVHEGTARASADGSARLGSWTGDPPAWALAFAERLWRSTVKKHGADASWPRKITRWREERE